MLDLRFIKEHEKEVRESILKRGLDVKNLNDLLNKAQDFSKIKEKVDSLRHERNLISEKINEAKKKNQEISQLIKKAKEIPRQLEKLESSFKTIEQEIQELVKKIPNVLDKEVPQGKEANQNKVTFTWGKKPKFKFQVKNHVELAEQLGLVDFEASARVSGNGFYYLKAELALLNNALIRFAIDHMKSKGYTYIEPPLIISRDVAAAAGDLEAFKMALYKIQDEESYLIPTAEHPILGMLSGKTIPESELPLKFFGYSMCFRKEVGAHGINEKGFWRTHQFNKVEQFIFCKPQDSGRYYVELRKNSEELIKALKLPYRILECCAGDLAVWKMRGEDIEVYRPTTKEYGEVGSLSNCGIYQAQDLQIKGANKNERYVLHTLNNTALATSRIMVAILENYQQKDGSIKVPQVLQKYCGFKVIKAKSKEKAKPVKKAKKAKTKKDK